MARKLICLMTVLLLAVGCDSKESSECPDGAGCTVSTVPDVEHQELRKAYQALIDAGFTPRFSPTLESEGYAEYVEDESMGMRPQPWVGDIDPEPGEDGREDGVVTITAIECPNGALFCD